MIAGAQIYNHNLAFLEGNDNNILAYCSKFKISEKQFIIKKVKNWVIISIELILSVSLIKIKLPRNHKYMCL